MSGKLRIRLVQMEVLPGKPWNNTAKVLEQLSAARADNVDLLVFPEMCVPGYLIGDEWEHDAFLRECEACGKEIEQASRGITAVFGNVGLDWSKHNEDGRVRKYNALFVASNGRIHGPEGTGFDFVVKTLLPNYRQFDDSRHFHDLRKVALERDCSLEDLIRPVTVNKLKLGCTLCEDVWEADYGFSPMAALAARSPDIMVNGSCSPYTFNKNSKRVQVFSSQAKRAGCPLLYANNVGIQNNGKTVFTFDGSSCVYDSLGGILAEAPRYEDTTITADIPLDRSKAQSNKAGTEQDTVADLYRAIEYGTRKFMDACGVKKVTVGISGGIDSSVVAAIYRRILAPEDLLLVNMPGEHTSRTTRTLAGELAERLGCLYAVVPISDSVSLTRQQVSGLRVTDMSGAVSTSLELSGAMLENVQARDRSSRVLSAISSAFGGVFTCNGNKAEATVGYATLYGDLAGYLANIADLWKMEVYELGRHLNKDIYPRKVIPDGCFDIRPSAELSPAHDVDRNMGDPLHYPYHDRLFKSWVEAWNRATPEDILEWRMEGALERNIGYEGNLDELFSSRPAFIEDLERWWNLYKGMGLAKRIQAPPVIAVKRRAFGFDHRESQIGPAYTRRYENLKNKYLG